MAAPRGRTESGSKPPVDDLPTPPSSRTSRARSRSAAAEDDAKLDLPGAAAPARSRSAGRTAPPQPVRIDSGRSPWLIVASVVAVVAILGALFFAWQWRQATAADGSRTEALAAAQNFVRDLSNYDYPEIDQDFQTVIGESTGAFKAEFSRNSSRVEASISQKQATAKGTILDAAVRDVSADSATVLVIVDQSVVEANPQAQRLAKGRLRLTLVRSGGNWLVSKLENL